MSVTQDRVVPEMPDRVRNWFFECRRDNLIARFAEINIRRSVRPPQDMLKFFVEFLTELRTFEAKPEVLQEMQDRYQGKVVLKKACGIALVLVSGEVRDLLPSKGLGVDSEYKETRHFEEGLIVKEENGLAVRGQGRHRAAVRHEMPSRALRRCN